MESTDKLRRSIIVDTDLSFDDYVALLYLLQHPGIDIRAITVVNGVVHVKAGMENALRLLAWIGRQDIPVAGGPDGPLTGGHVFPGRFRTIVDFGPRLLFPRISAVPQKLSAPELIRQQCWASDEPITFVALGPLTNLALALRADAALASRIKMIYISGGAINVPGTVHADTPANPNRVAEWNLYLDADAADEVFRAGIPIALVPMDVTHVIGPRPLLFTRDGVRRLRVAARGRASQLMVRLIYWWQLMMPSYPATPVWDAAVAALVAEPATGTVWRDLAIRVATGPREVCGQTIVEPDKPANARVCLEGNQSILEETYLAIARGAGSEMGEIC